MEYGAGYRLQKVLLEAGVTNMAVFVAREMGAHLGARRHVLIESAAKGTVNKLLKMTYEP